MMKNVIVTGANGFIGKTLVNALLEKGYHVVALDIRFDDVLANDDRVTCVNVLNKEVSEIKSETCASSIWHGLVLLALPGRTMLCS